MMFYRLFVMLLAIGLPTQSASSQAQPPAGLTEQEYLERLEVLSALFHFREGPLRDGVGIAVCPVEREVGADGLQALSETFGDDVFVAPADSEEPCDPCSLRLSRHAGRSVLCVRSLDEIRRRGPGVEHTMRAREYEVVVYFFELPHYLEDHHYRLRARGLAEAGRFTHWRVVQFEMRGRMGSSPPPPPPPTRP